MYHPLLYLLGFWYILPAYVANGFAVFAKVLKNHHLIDGGKLFRDNRPIFGGGKSWEGFFIGFFSGTIIGFLQVVSAPILLNLILTYLFLPLELYPIVQITLPLVLLVAIGALIGDLIGSFIKRRLNIERGQPAPVLDQLDFLIASVLLGMLVTPLPILLIIFLLLVTPILHLFANVIGYLLGLKHEPW